MKTEIVKKIKDAKRIVVKPDCTIAGNQLFCTHIDALRTLLSFIRPHAKGQIVLAESSIVGDTLDVFKGYGYLKLQEEYDLAFVDLNRDDFKIIELLDENEKTWPVKIASPLTDSDLIISIGPPKINHSLGFSGAINNIVLASLFRGTKTSKLFNFGKNDNHKQLVYGRDKTVHKNIVRLSKEFRIGISVIDGFETVLEGKAKDSEMLPTHFAIVGTDPLSTDILACKRLGLDNDKIGYLQTPSNLNWNNCYVAGDDWQKDL
jgi:uncharacterized protein (DUF362 family)